MLAVTSATGKLGSAVFSALLDNNLIDPSQLVVCTSSDPNTPKLSTLKSRSPNLTIRPANFDDPTTLHAAFQGCTRLFLVSTPRISMDYSNAPLWSGREAHHRAAIDAAISAGVKHIYYTSLAFQSPSKAAVMRAHIRTEAYLAKLSEEGKVSWTVLREGLYNESWPLYFGYYFALLEDPRKQVLVCGNGRISWTAIADMGFVTAKIITAPQEKWAGRTVYLSQRRTASLRDVAGMVSRSKGEEVELNIVNKKTHEDFYVQEMGMERPAVEWWSSTYDALVEGECEIDDSTLEDVLGRSGGRRRRWRGRLRR